MLSSEGVRVIARGYVRGVLDLVILADTHLPKRARDLPDELWQADSSSPSTATTTAPSHSHIPWDTVTPSGLRLLNPGSPTDRRRQPHCTT